MTRRYTLSERAGELREYCTIVIERCSRRDFTISEYAEYTGLSNSYANRLLQKLAKAGVIEGEKIEGHNGVDKWIYDAGTIDQRLLFTEDDR